MSSIWLKLGAEVRAALAGIRADNRLDAAIFLGDEALFSFMHQDKPPWYMPLRIVMRRHQNVAEEVAVGVSPNDHLGWLDWLIKAHANRKEVDDGGWLLDQTLRQLSSSLWLWMRSCSEYWHGWLPVVIWRRIARFLFFYGVTLLDVSPEKMDAWASQKLLERDRND